MAYSTISKPSLHFNTKLYAGNNTGQSITGVGFEPSLTWIKSRTASERHVLTDAVRGVYKELRSNETAAESDRTSYGGLSAFGADGFTVGGDDGYNNGSNNYASWNWKANGSGSANTDGSINSTVSVNTTAGFSISKYTGTGSNATVGHGLSAAPKMILFRNLTNSSTAWNWGVYHKDIGAGNVLHLNNTEALSSSATAFNSTDPTTNVFSVGSWGGTNYSGDNIIAYCFAEKAGYSKFGSYRGNGNANGTFVYCGFKPAFIIVKRTNTTSDWQLMDNKRDPINAMDTNLFPNTSDVDTSSSTYNTDFVSNGFKFRGTSGARNGSGDTYIFMAFAEEPLVANVGASIPATAR